MLNIFNQNYIMKKSWWEENYTSVVSGLKDATWIKLASYSNRSNMTLDIFGHAGNVMIASEGTNPLRKDS